MNISKYGGSSNSKITVALFFGKKDNIVLTHFKELVSKADFPFIVKAALKHYIKDDFFKIHVYTDLTSLLDCDLDKDIKNKTQRNVIFTLEDGFLFDWIEEIPQAQRGNKIKSILSECLLKSVDVLKNGEEKENLMVLS